MIVSFHDAVQLDRPWQFPFATVESTCAGEKLEPSYNFLARFWDSRSWYRAAVTWARHAVGRIFTLGYKYDKDKLGNPAYPARVWHPAGLFPTVLASGNAGLLRWPNLRAMCPLREAFNTWAGAPHAAADPAGCIHKRRPMPLECLSAKGFPADTPFDNDSDGFRFAGNAAPPSYFKRLFLAVTDVLDRVEVPLVLPRKSDEYITYCKEPLHPNDVDITIAHKMAGKPTEKGQNVRHSLNRDKLTNVPVTAEELKLMSDQLVGFSGARLADGSKNEAGMGWAH